MRILMIEDDEDFSYSIKVQLVDHGFDVDTCSNGSDGLFFLKQQTYHLILLDRKLPILNGMRFLQIIREQEISIPVIFITGIGELRQKIDGLNCGADDYLVKPFAFEELLARIHCILRRPQTLKTSHPVPIGNMIWHPNEQILSCNGKSIKMSGREATLFEFLKDHANLTLSREIILANAWEGNANVESRNVDNYIYLLRNHLKVLQSNTHLHTVRGLGYRLEVDK